MSDAFLGSRDAYSAGELREEDCLGDPLAMLRQWVDEAVASAILEPTAGSLATVGADGRPSNRMVLLRQIDTGLVFYSNYDSRKGRELANNPAAALTLFWASLQRQVRVEGSVDRLSAVASDAYFDSRPRESQLAAAASPQSQTIGSREELETLLFDASARFPGGVPRPDGWGGYRLSPERIEFWQGRPGRLHDRILFLRTGADWQRSRLAP